MENLDNLKLILESERLKVLARTDGSAVTRFLKLSGKEDIAEHLRLTVKTKEFR